MWRRLGGPLMLSLIFGVPIMLLAAFIAAVALTPLPTPQNPVASEIFDRNGSLLTRYYKEDRIEIPVIEMPQTVLDAVVAVEDHRFYAHRGFDFVGFGRAMIRNVRARRVVEGGSTITQQLAKNLYLTHDRTLIRKLKEAIRTVKLEYTYSKSELLGFYWNTIYLGSGTYGLEVASQTYFDKPARDLTLAEAALLAGLPRAPEYFSPFNNPKAAEQRRNLVLDKMQEHGFATPDAIAVARAEKPRIADPKAPPGEAPYFIDYVRKELGRDYPEIAANLYQGGYQIHTSLDLQAQRFAEEAVLAEAPPATPGDKQALQPQVALVSLEPNSGYIRALIGGREDRVIHNRALLPQQPGSAFKPFVYATALETRLYTVASTQPDAPAEFPGADEGEPWRPKNYGDRYTNQPVTMREALRRSLNVVTAHWTNTVKPKPVEELAHRMGVSSDIPDNLTIGLGTAELTPLELTRAFMPFANGGMAVEPVAIVRIEDRNGITIAQREPTRSSALDAGVAFIITDLLKEVVRPGGTAGNVAKYLGGRPAAGKTGTSDQSRDAWFVGYTPELVTGVWVGNDDNSPSHREGGTAAAPIWAYYTSRVLQGTPHRDWRPPSNVATHQICAGTGLRPNASCPTRDEWFLAGTEPTEVDPTVHWDHLLPSLPGMPWAPSGTLLPGADYEGPDEPFIPPIRMPRD
jgi:1A family penicillin-binding protein